MGEGRKRTVCHTKPRWHQFISASPPSSVIFVIGISGVTARINYWAGILGITTGIIYWGQVILLHQEIYWVISSLTGEYLSFWGEHHTLAKIQLLSIKSAEIQTIIKLAGIHTAVLLTLKLLPFTDTYRTLLYYIT